MEKHIEKKTIKTSAYVRAIDLPSLIPLWPKQIEDYSEEGTKKIIKHLNYAVRQERIRGQKGHWSYDLNKHKALLEALKHETLQLIKTKSKTVKKSYPQGGKLEKNKNNRII